MDAVHHQLQLGLMEDNKSLCMIDAKARNMRCIYQIVDVSYKPLFIVSRVTTSILNVRKTSLEAKTRPTIPYSPVLIYSASDGYYESGFGHGGESKSSSRTQAAQPSLLTLGTPAAVLP